MKRRITLGIETSCDETAAAVYHEERGILSSELFSQINLHQNFGGVIPEIASRTQLEKIEPIINQALSSAHVTLDDITTIAVTHKPGLPGSLLVGVCFAKAMAWAAQKKIIGINHLEGHAFSAFLEHPQIPFPHLCLTASGGHTSLYLIKGFGEYTIIGQTLDDAAGEAFDKISKLIGTGYPGGPIIEQLASQVSFQDFFHYPRAGKGLDFSFSGLKTAILYDLIKRDAYDMQKKIFLKSDDLYFKQQVASSLLVCVADIFKQKLLHAITRYPQIKAVTFVGGVACNKYIKQQIQDICEQKKISFFWPSPQYCTDNAAMIAFVGNYKAAQNKFSDFNLDILR